MKKIILPFLLLILMSCSSDSEKDFTQSNEKEILDYLSENNLEAQKSETGLYYIINEQGSGVQPTSNSNVTVSYKGYYSNAKVFDQSNSEGISFNLRGVIAGWTEGITYFKEGGSGMLLIPSRLAYGNKDYRGIPGGSVLIFDITLITVN